MIENIFLKKTIRHSILMMAGIFIFLSTSFVAWAADYNSAQNCFSGSYTSAPSYPNSQAFAALASDGSITAWGESTRGGSGAPSGTGYTHIYSNGFAFAALASDSSIAAWGDSTYGGSGAPSDTGYTEIYSNYRAFAALKSDGSITAWGYSLFGGTGEPSDSGYISIQSTDSAFAALKSDGSITAWGSTDGGSGAPSGTGYTSIYSTGGAFAALASDGSITAWGSSSFGGTGAPAGTGYTSIQSTGGAFAALAPDGSITTWGYSAYGNTGTPTDAGYTQIYSTGYAFAALKSDGSITAWGNSTNGGTGAPSDTGYVRIFATSNAFAALKSDGSITAWGNNGGTGAPSDSSYTRIYSNGTAFAAMKSDGSITSWGSSTNGGTGAPSDTGYTQIYSNAGVFLALKSDGSITAWGNSTHGGTGAPSGIGYTIPYGGFCAQSTIPTVSTPTLTDPTTPVTTITSTTATGNGEITDTGGEDPERFIEWGTISGTYTDNCSAGTGGVGTYSCQMTPLTPNTTYYFRAYATNSEGTTNGTESSFTTLLPNDTAISELNLSITIEEALSMNCGGDIDLDNGTALIAGIPQSNETTCTITTNDDQGYILSVINDNAGNALTNGSYSITDKTSWDNTSPNAQTWSGTGLGFSVYDSDASKDDSWWGTGSSCHDADNLYAGFPSVDTPIMEHEDFETSSTDTHICYRVDVPGTQASGEYEGSVTYTATGRP